MEMGEHAGGKGRLTPHRERLWPMIIAIALALVVLVNVVFLLIAISGADDVAPSYNQGER